MVLALTASTFIPYATLFRSDFNKRVGRSSGDVGIWHETYRVSAGVYECIYSGMPSFGLAKAATTVDTAGSLASARRSEEHTSELQSPCNIVCTLLLETNNML